MRLPIDTLIIVGNGFDIWQGLKTSYSSFQQYYYDHIDDILKQLHLKKHYLRNSEGKYIYVTDVELIYGDPFYPEHLPDGFWGSFETSLSDIDSELLNAFFDKTRSGLRKMNKCVNNAHRILQKAFCDWIGSIHIEPGESEYKFGDNCFIINFNYTDTLEKRFGVNDMQEYHIHGVAADADSIIFGHAAHPMGTMYTLRSHGDRFKGLYFIDKLLYETDKHVQDNIQMLCMALATSGVDDQAIKDVYVLGQSISPPDLQYYIFLNKALSVHHEISETEDDTHYDVEPDPMQELAGRLGYVIEHVGYNKPEEELPEEYLAAARRQYDEEQLLRNTRTERTFRRLLTLSAVKRWLIQRGKKSESHDFPRRIQKLDITKCDSMFARSFASYRLKMHLTVEAIEEKPLIFLHSKRAIT